MAKNSIRVAADPRRASLPQAPMDTAGAWEAFIETHSMLEGMRHAAGTPGESDELIARALEFHREVVEAYVRFAAASQDSAQIAAPSTIPSPNNGLPSWDGDLTLLTPREREVLKLIAQGSSSKQVAYSLGISFKTAVSHRYNIMEKLNIHDVSGLVRYAIRNGLIRP